MPGTVTGISTESSAKTNDRYYNGKEAQDVVGWYDFGARMYNPEIGRWMNIDPMSEADEDSSPYQYTSNNPVLNIDFFGLTDDVVEVDRGTTPEIVVRGKRNSNESTLDNIQLTLDGFGLYPGLGTIAGVANGFIDVKRGNYYSAGANFLSAIPGLGTGIKGSKFAVMGVKAIRVWRK